MSEYPIPPELQARYDEIKSAGQDACEYAIEQLPLIERISRLESENERLRQALERIKTKADEQYPVSIGNQWAWAQIADMARAALADKGKV